MPADLSSTATFETNGVRVDVALDRNPMPAGEPTWATMTVTNLGPDDLEWVHDGCAIEVGLWGRLNTTWHRGSTDGLGPQALDFWKLAFRFPDPGEIWLDFVPEEFVGEGSFGCADLAITDVVAPGASVSQRSLWDGFVGHSRVVPPSGGIDLEVSALYYERASTPDDQPGTLKLEFLVPAWVDGGSDGSTLDPPEIVEAALRDPDFAAWLETLDVGNSNEPRIWLDPGSGLWHVELLRYYYANGTIRGVLVDPTSGDVVDHVEYPWDGSFTHHP